MPTAPFLLRSIRYVVLIGNITLSLSLAIWVITTIPVGTIQIIKLTQLYALLALTMLYLAFLASPLTKAFPRLPGRGHYLRARRAIGVSACYFALLHASLAFWGQLGGLRGLPFLPNTYVVAISLSAAALVILCCMAATSFDRMVSLLGYRNWKRLHRLGYLAGILILIHALMLGTHFSDLSRFIPRLMFLAMAGLVSLEALRIDRYLEFRSATHEPQFAARFLTSLLGVSIVLYMASHGGNLSVGIHGHHQLKDPSKETYTVLLTPPSTITPGVAADLSFRIVTAQGTPITSFSNVNEKPLHLIIVDSALQHYQHLHPEQQGVSWQTTITFPHAGHYHLYFDFAPTAGSPQHVATTVTVLGEVLPTPTVSAVDYSLTKQVGGYDITLHPNMKEYLRFSVHDAATKQLVTKLQPYLGSHGHLVMIHRTTYEYIHVHPRTPLLSFLPQNRPALEFSLPPGQSSVTPGEYRLFLQVQPGSELLLADYTITIK